MMRLRLQMLTLVCDKVQLEQANVLGCRRVGRALEKRGESLAAVRCGFSACALPSLRAVHVLDHALAQRADGIRTHG